MLNKNSKMTNSEIKVSENSKISKIRNKIGIRHYQFTLVLITVIIFYGHRTVLSVGIIAMTDENTQNSSTPSYPEWDNTDTILSSFFWGFIVTPIIAGQLGEYFGPKWFVVGTMILGSIFNILIPVMAAWLGSYGVMICRIMQGLNQGFLFPSLLNLISKWTPVYERSIISCIIYGGSALGIALSMVITGTISASNLGWPVAFYLLGGCGILWAVIFGIFASTSPANHKSISLEEKLYIESSSSINQDSLKKNSTPWKSIMTSLPMWSILVTVSGQCWGTFTLLTEIPSYMKNIMDFDINSNSQLSALPYFVLFVMSFIASPIADKIIKSKILTTGITRKISNSLGTMLPAVALFVLGFIDKNEVDLAVALLVIAVGATAFTHPGSMINVVDISPNYAGTLVGIENTVTTIFSIMGPLSVEFLGNNKKDPTLWRTVFWMASGIYIGCGTFFAIFCSGEVQSWNDRGDNSKTIKH